ncbi:MAG: hypothetical protein WD830_08370 [Chloroflexota bacterium]
MDEIIRDERAEDEAEIEAPGRTMVLTELGWEWSEYVDPESDWSVLADGSYRSPDGTIRTWPLAGSEAQ